MVQAFDATSLNELRQTWIPRVEERMFQVARAVAPEHSSLLEMVDAHLATGGKRLRALIPIATAHVLGLDPDKLLGFAAGCEMLHNATLVHDDLQDEDEVRRGQPTTWVRYGAARAINLGDAMLYWAIAALDDDGLDAATRLRATRRMVTDALAVIDGQEREFLLQAQAEPTIDGYMRMVTGKTSGLFRLPLAGAAEICGADADTIRALELAAADLGVLFQLQDDVLDLYGDKGRAERGSDIGEGKYSALVAHYTRHASPEDGAWLREVLRAPREALTSAIVDDVAQRFQVQGSLQWVLDEIERRRVGATDAVDAPLSNLVATLGDAFVRPIAHVGQPA